MPRKLKNFKRKKKNKLRDKEFKMRNSLKRKLNKKPHLPLPLLKPRLILLRIKKPKKKLLPLK